jgi:hypothetical protein
MDYRHGFLARLLATTLAAALLVVFSPLPVLAQGQAKLHGTVAAPDGTPIQGARVHAMHPGSETVLTSAATTSDGRFVLEGLPQGTHQLAVELADGIYSVASPVELSAGEWRQLNLLVATDAAPATRADAAPQAPGLAAVWSSPLMATLVVVGAAVGVGAILDSATSNDDDEEASPF